jgi:hypothetical protein
MLGGWTNHGYKMSHDGQTVLVHQFDGFDLLRGSQKTSYKLAITNRELFWAPDSKKFAFWSPEGLAVAELETIGPGNGPPKYKVIYKPVEGRFPFGMEWSPFGNDVYVIETFDETDPKTKSRKTGTSIKRIPSTGGTPKEIVTHPTTINFFMPPVSRFEHGQGPSNRPYSIVFGAPDGLFIVDRDGKKIERLTEVPAVGLNNLEWSPGAKEKMVLFFKRPEPNAKGEKLQGVYVVHVDRRGEKTDAKELFEQVHPNLDVHTLWFSPKGTYATWATNDAVYFRQPDATGAAVKIEPKDERGLFLEVKGCAWNHGEDKLAITAGNKLFIYDVAKKTLVAVSTFGKEGKSFAAEPVWRDDKVVLSVFNDIAGSRPTRGPKKKP